MVVGQFGKVTGTSFEGGTIIEDLRGFLGVATSSDWLTIAVAASTLAVILLLRLLAPALPAPLIAVVLATIASLVFDLGSQGVALVGEVPSGLPLPGLPDVTFEDVTMLVFAGLGITIVGYSDIMLIARGFPLAPAEGEPPPAFGPIRRRRRDGRVHAMVGIFSGYPVSASGSRTALAIAGGARSQVYSLVAALCIIAVLFFAGPLMAPLPWAALGAVVFYAGGKLVSIREFRRLWRFRRREFYWPSSPWSVPW